MILSESLLYKEGFFFGGEQLSLNRSLILI